MKKPKQNSGGMSIQHDVSAKTHDKKPKQMLRGMSRQKPKQNAEGHVTSLYKSIMRTKKSLMSKHS